ncbi:MAG: hypothetical protein K2X01_09730 [Cyanobacteria bacterium]|nr:hypothetical protein [Cyanobacteriota bacterium]
MSYHHCRWYDPYPRLVFALKLLFFAPRAQQQAVVADLLGLLIGQLGTEPELNPGRSSQTATRSKKIGSRWYDQIENATDWMGLLAASPESLKLMTADWLLDAVCLNMSPRHDLSVLEAPNDRPLNRSA